MHLPGGHSADELHVAMQQVITTLPGQAWLTLTWDQGAEMAHHHHIASWFPEGIYFAHPGSPWQRGSNENTVDCCASTSRKALTSQSTTLTI